LIFLLIRKAEIHLKREENYEQRRERLKSTSLDKNSQITQEYILKKKRAYIILDEKKRILTKIEEILV